MKERIIILEDEFLISEDLRTMLEMEGYDVVAIETSGQETI
ncbi:MAG: response regulator, partial [Candidatus Cloacimonetes bacterium]|nr:response regulator [Candidatus Cloacimonadota bacterium]